MFNFSWELPLWTTSKVLKEIEHWVFRLILFNSHAHSVKFLYLQMKYCSPLHVFLGFDLLASTTGWQSLPVAFGAETAKWICVGAIDITQISVAGKLMMDSAIMFCMFSYHVICSNPCIIMNVGYLLLSGKPYYALALLALIAPQIVFQVKNATSNLYFNVPPNKHHKITYILPCMWY